MAGQPYGQPLGGNVQISRNGRYVRDYGGWAAFLGPVYSYDTLLDLQTGAMIHPGTRPSNTRQVLTSDGSVLGFDPQTGMLKLGNASGSRVIPTTEMPTMAIVNDAGTEVVYEAMVNPTSIHLRAINLGTGTDTLIGASAVPQDMQPSISNDGTLVSYVGNPALGQVRQVWLARLDGSDVRQLTNFAEGVSEAILAGSGTAVLAVSGSRIVSIDTQSAAVREVIGTTPICNYGFGSLIPGSILPINGTSLASSTQVAPVPLPNSLDGVQVLMNGTPFPILSISPTAVWFQVPFELTPGPLVTVGLLHSSSFEGCPARGLYIVPRVPYLVADSANDLTLAHQDFQSLVTFTSPVQPGEIVHALAVGLGVTVPPMQTGIPTPVGQLFKLADPIDCSIGLALGGPQLNVPFAGLAPGAIGVYQVDVQMPSPLPSQGFFLNCGTPGNILARSAGYVPVTSPPQ